MGTIGETAPPTSIAQPRTHARLLTGTEAGAAVRSPSTGSILHAIPLEMPMSCVIALALCRVLLRHPSIEQCRFRVGLHETRVGGVSLHAALATTVPRFTGLSLEFHRSITRLH